MRLDVRLFINLYSWSQSFSFFTLYNANIRLQISFLSCFFSWSNLCVFRTHGEDPEVSTILNAVATVVGAQCHKSVKSKPKLLATCFPADLESFWSETKKTLNCCSWTTELIVERSPKTSQHSREKTSSSAQKNSTSDSPMAKLSLRRFQLNEQSCFNFMSESSGLESSTRLIVRANWLAVQTLAIKQSAFFLT